MALGFTSHYKPDDTNFGSLTQPVHSSESDSETAGQVAGLICSPPVGPQGENCDCCEFSTTVEIDYSQYSAVIADGSSSETAGSIAFSGGSFDGGGAVASFSGGGASFSGGGGGMSCASFTC